MSNPGGATPPGWYPDGSGGHRWWDGAAWGPHAPRPVGSASLDPVEAGRAMATLAHAGALVGGFVLPLILYLTEGKKNPYVHHHAQEALNFQLSVLAVSGLLSITSMGFFFGGLASPVLLVGFGFGMIVALCAGVGALVFAIIGASKAWNGEAWRYPISMRFVRS